MMMIFNDTLQPEWINLETFGLTSSLDQAKHSE